MKEKFNPAERTLPGRVDRAIAENPGMEPAKAAAAETVTGILAPLVELGDLLGLTQDETAVILKYADRVSTEIEKRVEAELVRSPLFQMDALFAKQSSEIIRSEDMVPRDKEDKLFKLELARRALRETQGNIKEQVAQERQLAQESGEDADLPLIIQRICANQKPQKEDVSGFFYTKLAVGSDYDLITNIICGPELSEKIADRLPVIKQTGGKEKLHNISVEIAGVIGEVPHLSTQYGHAYIHFGVVFDQDAVLRIAQSADLPPLNKVG